MIIDRDPGDETHEASVDCACPEGAVCKTPLCLRLARRDPAIAAGTERILGIVGATGTLSQRVLTRMERLQLAQRQHRQGRV